LFSEHPNTLVTRSGQVHRHRRNDQEV